MGCAWGASHVACHGMACHVTSVSHETKGKLYIYGPGGALDESTVEVGAQVVGAHAPITPNFPSSSSHEIGGYHVEK